MSITKRKDKDGKNRWLVRIESPDPVTGARRRVAVGTFPTRREAEKAEAKAITTRENGTLLERSSATVGDVLDRYLADEMPKTVAEENQQEYRIIVDKHIRPALGHHGVQKLKAQHIDAFYGDLIRREYSASWIRKCHQRLATSLRMAVRWGLVARNVADDVTPPKMTTKPGRIWTPGEAARFLATSKRETDPLLAYWTLMLDSGGRTSEVLGVAWGDIDLDRGTVRLGEQVVRLRGGTPVLKLGGKSDAARRTVQVAGGTAELLRAHRTAWLQAKLASGDPAWNPHGLVFVSRSGRPLNARNVRRSFDRMVKLAGVPVVSPHDLRRTNITASIAAGAPLRAVQARAGHSDPRTTLGTYVALTRGQEDQLLDVVEALMTATPAPLRDATA